MVSSDLASKKVTSALDLSPSAHPTAKYNHRHREQTDNERSDKIYPGDGNFRTDRRATRGNRRPHRRYVSEQPDAHRVIATRHAVPIFQANHTKPKTPQWRLFETKVGNPPNDTIKLTLDLYLTQDLPCTFLIEPDADGLRRPFPVVKPDSSMPMGKPQASDEGLRPLAVALAVPFRILDLGGWMSRLEPTARARSLFSSLQFPTKDTSLVSLVLAEQPLVMELPLVSPASCELRWVREFKNSRTDVHDEPRAGRPSVSDETIAKVEAAMLEDRRVTVRKLCDLVPDVSKTTIDKILREQLGYSKPGVAPSDFHFFPELKKNLGGTQFQDDDELEEAVLGFYVARRQTPESTLSTIQRVTGTQVSKMTINRRLRERNLRARRPLRCLPLTPVHRQVRLQWCRERSTWNCADWGRIVFSDESRFLLCPDDRRKRVWRRHGQRVDPGLTVKHHTGPQQGVMVWGAIKFDSRTPLVVIPGTLTAQRYVDDILRPVLLPFLSHHLGLLFNKIMPGHTRNVLLWIVFNLAELFRGHQGRLISRP
ncbi:hypothetical protein LAZ67_17003118 [Cordylochernes scorpioides]|uniref:Transposase Tc1-like domain-containing protein n=1 Tax=Cordylochernes scorpioides TaxID=51811 RepID=A0ABY6LEG3_9ARAC|nr:hypothetical protein LAZ67_17003118 [Cordylochernes scorpioides]